MDGVLSKCLEALQKIRRHEGDPAHFWPLYLDALRDACASGAAVVAARGVKAGSLWQPVAFSPAATRTSAFAQTLMGALDAGADACAKDGAALIGGGAIPKFLAVMLATGDEGRTCVALFHRDGADDAGSGETLDLLRLLNDVPADYRLRRSAHEAIVRQGHFSSVLELMVRMNAQEKFLSAAMTFCNELAARHRCERVSLGWLKEGYVRLQAMSHVDDFDKKMDVVQALERTLEEALDQDAEILFPPAEGNKSVSREHEAFARSQEVAHMVSFPLRVNGEPVAVCSCERQSAVFTETELRLLRLSCDQAARRLDDLKRHDRWFGARLAADLRKKLEKLVGFEHTWAKGLAILGSFLLAVICFVPITYRLESPIILKADDLSYLTSPFDGYIEAVSIRPGEEVKPGQELLRLDQSDLLLQEAGLVAEKNRYTRESEKARAANALADMRISAALADQSAAQLDLVRYRLGQAVIRSPFAGVIVEGDQVERVGSPVKQGDVLFRVGRTDKYYAELEVRESEIHHVALGMKGDLALASRPQKKFKIQVFRIQPAAVAKKNGNVYLVHANFLKDIPSWGRPGMTGVSKLNAGKKTLLWIFTHRTMDFLRLKLWW
jgi:multidrug resistance efflux pump